MNISNKNILLISPESWGKSHVSKHHYALELAKNGANVYFLNGPSLGLKQTSIHPNLVVLDYKSRYRGLAKLPFRITAYLTKREVNTLERFLGLTFDIIWNFDSSRFFNLKALKNKLRICHIVDMAENIQRSTLASTSDICFCTSDYIFKEIEPYNGNVYKINHGYQVPHSMKHLDILDSKGLKVGVIGNLTRSCIDWNVIFQLIDNHPSVHFHFVGSYQESNLAKNTLDKTILDKLKNYLNVHLYGPIDSELIPSFLGQMDILLCVYKMESEADFAQHSNLHKTMEYFGSGKVIVTSWVDEYKDQLNLIKMTKVNTEIPDLFAETILNLETENNPEKMEARKVYALQNTYSKQLANILNLIEQNV